MSLPAIAVTDEQLRDAHRQLDHAVSFEVMKQCPALLICLRNLAEINARRRDRAANDEALRRWAAPRRPAPLRPVAFDPKRAAAHDID